ncbi:unnamed protein product [Cylicostephanus goldi]|uniref:CCHC-type domain-containing protein n=1 Tax=Cylicostephanus goldi TaxID=71465 RepID=A0A3P7QL94_CYLGO|nr:unnamed protein product [Cylicostephanus goldi]
MGLQSPCDAPIRARLLSKLDTETDTYKLQDLTVDYNAYQSVQKDAALIGFASAPVQAEVVAPIRKKKQRRPPPQRTRRSSESKDPPGRSRRDDVCYNCGNKGHWANNCPSRNRPVRRSMKKVVKLNVLNSHRRYVNVKLKGLDVKMQLDTGADVPTISHKTWIGLGSPTLKAPPAELRAANGSLVEVLGVHEMPFTCNGFDGQGLFYVTKDLCLLRMDVLQQLRPFQDAFSAVCCVVMPLHHWTNALRR